MTIRRPALRVVTALFASLTALAACSGCAEMIGLEEDPADSAVGAAKAAKKMQNERYRRSNEATSLFDKKS